MKTLILHVIELADGSRKHGIVSDRGHAKVEIIDVSVILENALLILVCKQNISSVHSITENGFQILYKPISAELKDLMETPSVLKKMENCIF